ncbi:cell division protein ZapA [Camelimonas abortus]|uniref:Cell division protein ZapA n=1 Tax=Camelimonas abortus TaxID=1017184 RepID=A0ABV7LDK0_9HYPH
MAQLNVTIAGKIYRMACGDGEEEHLAGLAAEFDRRVTDMQQAFGPIGDLRLHVMAALTVLDELVEARRRLEEAETEVRAMRVAMAGGERRAEEAEAQAAQALIRVSERIEALARELNPLSAAGRDAGPAPTFAVRPAREG